MIHPKILHLGECRYDVKDFVGVLPLLELVQLGVGTVGFMPRRYGISNGNAKFDTMCINGLKGVCRLLGKLDALLCEGQAERFYGLNIAFQLAIIGLFSMD